MTQRATAEKPLVIEYEQGASVYALYDPVVEDTQFFNIQILTRSPRSNLNIRQQWDWPPPHDFDLLLYGRYGQRVADSEAILPVADPHNPDSGPGYEMIKDHEVERCDGYTIESKGFLTTGATLRLEIWLD